MKKFMTKDYVKFINANTITVEQKNKGSSHLRWYYNEGNLEADGNQPMSTSSAKEANSVKDSSSSEKVSSSSEKVSSSSEHSLTSYARVSGNNELIWQTIDESEMLWF